MQKYFFPITSIELHLFILCSPTSDRVWSPPVQAHRHSSVFVRFLHILWLNAGVKLKSYGFEEVYKMKWVVICTSCFERFAAVYHFKVKSSKFQKTQNFKRPFSPTVRREKLYKRERLSSSLGWFVSLPPYLKTRRSLSFSGSPWRRQTRLII